MKRLIVIGAGPMGIEAALAAQERGFDVTVLEAREIGSALRRWGSVRFFSPLGMNVSPRVKKALGEALPPLDSLLTGPEMVDRVLQPLVDGPLAGRVRTRHKVVAVSRARLGRLELPGHPIRAERPFRLLVDTPHGEEVFESEMVLDASGVQGQPMPTGAGGMPSPGERILSSERVMRDLGTLAARLDRLEGARLMLVGHGHSAAHAVAWLTEHAEKHGGRTIWVTRSANRRPCVEVAGDPLPERERVVLAANALAESPPGSLTVERRAQVLAIRPGKSGLEVTLTGDRQHAIDAIVSLTGYRPDLTIVSELALEISPISEGAGPLYRALASITDCLSVPTLAARDLASGEPGFHLIGIKSYGRLPTFLLKTGLAQLESILG